MLSSVDELCISYSLVVAAKDLRTLCSLAKTCAAGARMHATTKTAKLIMP